MTFVPATQRQAPTPSTGGFDRLDAGTLVRYFGYRREAGASEPTGS